MRLRTLPVVAVLCWAFASPAAAQAPAPILTTLDSVGDVGRSSDVAIRPDGRGVIAYTDATNGALKIASCANAACTAAVLRTIDPNGPFDSVSVAVGLSGEPMVAYQRHPSGSGPHAVMFAHCHDPECTSASAFPIDLADALVPETDITVDRDGRAVVVYAEANEHALRLARCLNFACTEQTLAVHPDDSFAPSIAYPRVILGASGLPVFVSNLAGGDIRVGVCLHQTCTNATFARLDGDPNPPFVSTYFEPSVALGADGRVVVGFSNIENTQIPPQPTWHVLFARCADLACTSIVPAGTIADDNLELRLAIAPGDRPLGVYVGGAGSPLRFKRCLDASCSAPSSEVAFGGGNDRGHAMAVDAVGNALVSFYDGTNQDLRVAFLGTPPEISIGDAAVFEGNSGQTLLHLPVSLSGADSATVDFASVDGTATSPSDYAPTSGTLTFTPGTSTLFVTVSVVGDVAVEPDETFRVLLSNPVGAPIVDGEGIGTIRDDDGARSLSVSDASVVEGDVGSISVLLEATLDPPSPTPVFVDYITQNGTATAGTDYAASSGTVSFAPGQTTALVEIAVFGDTVAEDDETFLVRLQNPQGAVIDDGEGIGTITNDDGAPEAPLLGELRHGTSYTGELTAVNPGPTADADDFRLAQDPFASYEVVVDATSGDAVPLLLERRDSGGVLQSGTPVGAGPSLALRWMVTATAPVTGEVIRVAGDCGAACGLDDVYRVRAYETTLRAARFNNAGDQATVLVLANPGADPVALAVRFWGPDGTMLATHTPAASLAPHGVLVLDTSAIVPGASGSVTVAHDAAYGGLAGKAVALEPSTGFSFDTPFEPRPR
jgi:hypothetical protein